MQREWLAVDWAAFFGLAQFHSGERQRPVPHWFLDVPYAVLQGGSKRVPREFLAGEEASVRIQMVSATVLQMVQVGACAG